MTGLERHLIEAAKQGDSRAFDELFLQQQKYLFNLMYQLCGDIAGADDLTQEAIILAYKNIRDFRYESSFRTWLSRIAINLFRLECRRKPKHYSLCLEKITVPSHQDNPERVVIKSELQWCILHNLQQHLPKKYREVLVLRDLHHLSYKEISEILEWNVSKTKTRLHRARQMFRQQFINNKCKAFADDYLCICEGILEL
jgi:RNA polymerase sigma-70 factor (ECF subfamily)